MDSPAATEVGYHRRRMANSEWRVISFPFAIRHSPLAFLSSHPGTDRPTHPGAAEAAIAVGILRQILLVIILGEIERRGIPDFRGDRSHPFGRERLGVGRLGRFRGGVLLRRGRIGAGTVLGADFAALA